MADLTFSQQVWLSIIDKLALGTALVAVGYWANRKLEAHKVREALRSKLAEQRIPKIAGHVERFNAIEAATRVVVSQDWFVAITDAKHSIGNSRGHEHPHQAFNRLWDSRTQLRREQISRIEGARDQIISDRFWIGAEFADLLAVQYNELYKVHVHAQYALEYARQMSHLNSYEDLNKLIAGQEPTTWLGRARKWFASKRQQGRLRRYGLSMDFSGTDVARMLARISEE